MNKPLNLKSTITRVTINSFFLSFFILLCFSGDTNAQTPADHVILISIDGFRPEFYQDEKRPAPMLQYMAREGVQADGVRGIFPSVTYPSHTTLVTGAFPVDHGIFYNAVFNPEERSNDWYWEYDAITTQTLWNAANDQELLTASIGWPVTVGAPIDLNIPEVWDPEGEWIQAIRRHTTPVGLLEEIEERATGKLEGDMFSGRYNMREDRVGAMASYMIKEYKPNLLTVHIVSTDYNQHRHGRDHYLVDRAISAADRAVARMVEAADQAGILNRTAFVVSGDHGFTNISASVSPNVWLVEAGIMEDRNDRGDWKATFQTGGGSAFLEMRDPDDTETLETVLNLLESLPESTKGLFRIVHRDELDEIGANPNTPIALTASPIATMSSASSGPAVKSASGGTHGHFPNFNNMETGLVAWGSGVNKNVRTSKIGMEDIAPFVANLLGIPFEQAEGLFIPGFIEND